MIDPAGRTPLLQFSNYGLEVSIGGRLRQALRSLDISIAQGEAVALVGESGSGKSLSARSVLRLTPPGARTSGDILFEGRSVMNMNRRELRRFRSHDVAMVFQDARAHINPVHSVGDFLCEGLVTTHGIDRTEAKRRTLRLLRDVGIQDAERRLNQRPHELSGGLLQRVMIAAALATDPQLIIADEPTTALDVTTQEEVVAILKERCEARGLALLFISHDVDLARAICDRILVMYAGSVVEYASADQSHSPTHPYTAALLRARPPIDHRLPRLEAIPGRPTSAFEAGDGCSFASRCPFVQNVCLGERPPLVAVDDGHAACHFAGQLSFQSTKEAV